MLDNFKIILPGGQPLPSGEAVPVPVRNARRRLSTGDAMFWREVGEGRPVAFLHGNWTDGSEWEPLMGAFARHYTCLAPDLLGVGESEAAAPADLTIATQVTALEELFRSLRLDPIWLVGCGLGAWVALSYGAAHPDRVAGVVVIDPEGFALRSQSARRDRRRLRAARSPLVLAAVTLLKPAIGKRPSVQRTLELRQNLKRFPHTRQLLLRAKAVQATELLDDRLQGLPFPVVLVESDRDDPLTRDRGDACTLAIPHLRRERLTASDRYFWRHDIAATAELLHRTIAP